MSVIVDTGQRADCDNQWRQERAWRCQRGPGMAALLGMSGRRDSSASSLPQRAPTCRDTLESQPPRSGGNDTLKPARPRPAAPATSHTGWNLIPLCPAVLPLRVSPRCPSSSRRERPRSSTPSACAASLRLRVSLRPRVAHVGQEPHGRDAACFSGRRVRGRVLRAPLLEA